MHQIIKDKMHEETFKIRNEYLNKDMDIINKFKQSSPVLSQID